MDNVLLMCRFNNLKQLCGVQMRKLNAALAEWLVDGSAARHYDELVNRVAGRSFVLGLTNNLGDVSANYEN